ncbi:hypothetical protein PUMCH_001642 [Australozyma saopauloensis]|uniref:CNH domain-containing protein n=1 Tax=Australozyma saopauloensis TaxID=291208 RepID=A0AAX4H718_9ASCO|nr:hypothetical protein PUMCH_001642 [[Candida] saopauloensis]
MDSELPKAPKITKGETSDKTEAAQDTENSNSAGSECGDSEVIKHDPVEPEVENEDNTEGKTESEMPEINEVKSEDVSENFEAESTAIALETGAFSSQDQTQIPTEIESQEPQKLLLPDGYCIKKLDLQLELGSSESICAIAAHESNLYLGLTNGRLFHLYLFEDADDYIAITQLSISKGSPVKKILLLPDEELCLVLCNKVIYTYQLPELSPCNVGKLKDVEDILMLSQVKNPKVKSKLNKIVAFTSTKIRLIQFSKDAVKLLKDIPYLGSVSGISSASGTLANYSNICFVANDKNYDVVDIQQTRRIPLSEYNPTNVEFANQKVTPYIIPFHAEDKEDKPEEYLLLICSDVSGSMASFVNPEGDVIRGTLIWLQEGYPTGGLAVEWPHVFGLFWNEADQIFRLCVNSLVTLESEYVNSASQIFDNGLDRIEDLRIRAVEPGFAVLDSELLDQLQLQSCLDRRIIPSSKHYKIASIAFIGGHDLLLLDKPSALALALRETVDRFDKASSEAEVKQYASKLKKLAKKCEQIWSLYIASLFLAGQYEEVKSFVRGQHQGRRKVDPRLVLFLSWKVNDSAAKFWSEFCLPKLTLDLIDLQTKRQDSPSTEEMKTWIIEEIFHNKEHYDQETNANFRYYMYTETRRDTGALLELIDTEKEMWIAQNEISDRLIEYFKKENRNLVLIHVYLLKQKEGNKFDDWELRIIELGLSVLSNYEQQTESEKKILVQDRRFDIVAIVFTQLHQHIEDENYFAKKLLELLKLRPEEGLTLLKKNKSGKFQSCIKTILTELSKLVELDSQFRSLKLDYAEQAFVTSLNCETDSGSQAQDFAAELSSFINEEISDDEFQNLNILYQTYQVENDLKDSSWPKITWIEFLHLHFKSSECKELSQMYLKLYEVSLILSTKGLEVDSTLNYKNPPLQYLELLWNSDSTIPSLLALRDYSTAEWVAIYKTFPLPRTTIYSKRELFRLISPRKLSSEEVHTNIKSILNFYLDLPDEEVRKATATHVINSYAMEHFSFLEILNLIPESLSLWCVQDYIAEKLISLKKEQADTSMRKILSRLDAKFSKSLLQSFTKSHAEILQ